MLGSLCRWLRMAGMDTTYPGELKDIELEKMAAIEGRILLTRDSELARRVLGAVLLTSTQLDAQLRQVERETGLVLEFKMVRCTACNGELELINERERGVVPKGVLERGLDAWMCANCKKTYWEGSHCEGIKRRFTQLHRDSSPFR